MMTVPEIYCADEAIHRIFNRFYKVRLDCHAALAMTVESSLLTMTLCKFHAIYDTYKLLVQTTGKSYMHLINSLGMHKHTHVFARNNVTKQSRLVCLKFIFSITGLPRSAPNHKPLLSELWPTSGPAQQSFSKSRSCL